MKYMDFNAYLSPRDLSALSFTDVKMGWKGFFSVRLMDVMVSDRPTRKVITCLLL